MAEEFGWKGPLEIPPAQPLPRQGHLQQVMQELIQVGLGCPREGEPPLPGALAGLCGMNFFLTPPEKI